MEIIKGGWTTYSEFGEFLDKIFLVLSSEFVGLNSLHICYLILIKIMIEINALLFINIALNYIDH